MAGADRELIATVRHGLAAAADPARAPGMRAYLKSTLPCHGVTLAALRGVCRAALAAHPPASAASWQATVLALWREAAYREERHAALALTGWPGAAAWQTPALMPMYDELVVTGAWWDLVDDVATHRIGPLLRAFPDDLTPVLLGWSTDADRWRRRTSVICQVGAKERTDTDLLATCIGANTADRDFFLRKAIGWALRDYARTEPEWVRRYVAEHAAELSPLSRREALKHLG